MTEQAAYRIRVRGWIDQRWQYWFDGMSIALEQGRDGRPVTTLIGAVLDQAALRGILCQLWDLNLSLISVSQVDADQAEWKGGQK